MRVKCQSWRFESEVGEAVKYGLGFLWMSVDSLRRRRVDGDVILNFLAFWCVLWAVV